MAEADKLGLTQAVQAEIRNGIDTLYNQGERVTKASEMIDLLAPDSYDHLIVGTFNPLASVDGTDLD